MALTPEPPNSSQRSSSYENPINTNRKIVNNNLLIDKKTFSPITLLAHVRDSAKNIQDYTQNFTQPHSNQFEDININSNFEYEYESRLPKLFSSNMDEIHKSYMKKLLNKPIEIKNTNEKSPLTCIRKLQCLEMRKETQKRNKEKLFRVIITNQ